MNARLRPDHPLPDELRRVASDEIAQALALLTNDELPRAQLLHETRKRLKKLRAALALVQSGDETLVSAEGRRYRDMARELAGAREASALIETLDRFERDFPKQTRDGQLQALRTEFETRRDALLEDDKALGRAIADAVASCREGLEAIGRFAAGDKPEDAATIVAAGAADTLKAARRAIVKADDGGHAEDFHDLRKAVKRHWTQLDHLGDLWPGPVAQRRRGLARLGDVLGELNDIAVMRTVLEATRLRGEAGQGKALLVKLMARREKDLRKRSLARANKLFAVRPKAVRKAIAAAWRAAAEHPAPVVAQAA